MRALFVATAVMTLATGCAATKALQNPARVEVLPNDDFELSGVRVGIRGSSLEVIGAVRRRHPLARAIGAHLVVEAFRGNERLAGKRAWWSVMSMHRLPGGRFQSLLAGDALRADRVRIAIHPFHRREAEQDNLND
ncbi:hypothetical protein GCM10011515_15700 [Tsuneonella deserti]|uniref:Lipoprotein n=1 Tax=Tsuneonella deserti TaxID=2035528 RepID=A0ABQ1S918_9SPHN|nr:MULTISPECIES: hypothetical protein [Tsuneonella]GGD96758.1 hypothetical protein GCM10011515_15700 [Tsuneonella deserti]